MPNVHLALDPEFSMKGKYPPGKVVGTLDAADINFASNYLANLVRENNLTAENFDHSSLYGKHGDQLQKYSNDAGSANCDEYGRLGRRSEKNRHL